MPFGRREREQRRELRGEIVDVPVRKAHELPVLRRILGSDARGDRGHA